MEIPRHYADGNSGQTLNEAGLDQLISTISLSINDIHASGQTSSNNIRICRGSIIVQFHEQKTI